jgi:hypothetical protein
MGLAFRVDFTGRGQMMKASLRAAPKRRKPERRKLVYQFRIELQHIPLPIWRQILVPTTYNFWDLHVAIQDAMGWEDRHLHMFRGGTEQGNVEIGIPQEQWGGQTCDPSWEVPVHQVFGLPGDSITYEYDFGDGWEHDVLLEGLLLAAPGEKYPVCLAGARACPPEDCGGPPGYERFLEAIADPKHEQHAELLEWVGGFFDPEAFDPARVKFDDPEKRWKKAFQGEPI